MGLGGKGHFRIDHRARSRCRLLAGRMLATLSKSAAFPIHVAVLCCPLALAEQAQCVPRHPSGYPPPDGPMRLGPAFAPPHGGPRAQEWFRPATTRNAAALPGGTASTLPLGQGPRVRQPLLQLRSGSGPGPGA